MITPATTLAVAGLARAGQCRCGFAPADARPEYGVGYFGPRYAWTQDWNVIVYDEEVDVRQEYTLEIMQNTTCARVFELKQRDQTPVDLTNCTVKMQARTDEGDLVFTVSSEVDPGGTGAPWFQGFVVDGPLGKVTLTLAPADTALIPVGGYVYDILITFSIDNVQPLVGGSVNVAASVTA